MDNIPQAIFDFFERMPRQGPGSVHLTSQLFQRFRSLLPAKPVGADMGCGSGAAALTLAAHGASVTGVDIHQPFLDEMMRKAKARGLGHLVCHQRASMTEANFANDALDFIWSEGAVFTVGFENALKAFYPWLKSGGLLAVSDCFFFENNTPDVVRKQWDEWDCNLKTVAESLQIAFGLGYRFLHSEMVTPEMWEDNFYHPMELVINDIKADPNSPEDLLDMAERQHFELEFFRKYSRYYGYVFHVLQKP